jgi:CheY-like chemotaxis protein/nitrogen-specific signal transduction histidine kinase
MRQNKKLKKSVKELDNALAEAKSANEIKNLFLANMSHEIRTPLNGMLTVAQAMKTTGLDRTQSSYIDSIEQSGTVLKSLINDLLDLSSIEADKVKINAEAVKVRKIIDDVLLQVESLFQDNKELDGRLSDEIKFTYSIDLSVPEYIVADGIRLGQVIVNLISNARKFTKNGGVELKIGGEMADTDHFNLCIEVSDTGEGIPADKLDAIFENFHQLSENRTHNSGVGLGLPISKKIIDAMNGAIRVESSPGKGTKFIIDAIFPIAESGPQISKSQNASIHGITILLVDDDEISRYAVKTLLENQGTNVITADNGNQAIETLKEKTVDAILMDVYMPVLNGIEATEIIKSEKLSIAPIIGITASVMLVEREQYFIAGMDALLEKPIIIDQLIEIISHKISC